MTLCREWTLVKSTGDEYYAKCLKCRSWGCEFCRPTRHGQLIARAIAGAPNRFLTLTINPRVGSDPADRLRILSHSWNVLVKRLRRLKAGKSIEYLAVVEETKAGEPHLHILLRSPYLEHSMLSEAMDELAESPIVDIRRIRGASEVAAYVAKYIAKAPAQFGSAKRYWTSKEYELPSDRPAPEIPAPEVRWDVWRARLPDLIHEWSNLGYLTRQWWQETIVAFRPERAPP